MRQILPKTSDEELELWRLHIDSGLMPKMKQKSKKSIDDALVLIGQYATRYGLNGDQIEEIFKAGIGAASFLKPELIRAATKLDQ